jgi:hypothetical protein
MQAKTTMLRRVILSICFGAFYYASIVIGDAYGAGSSWKYGAGHAIFFGTFFFITTLPIILFVQSRITRAVRWWRGTPSGHVPLWEFAPIAALSILFLSELPFLSPERQFTFFVADPKPPSVRDISWWHSNGYGGGSWMCSLRIAPDEFEQLLKRHPFKAETRPEGYDLVLLRSMVQRDPDFPIAYPAEPMVLCYSYAIPTHKGDTWVTIYANQARDLVYVLGGSG